MANVYKSVLESGGVTPTPITPSNSSPASMTAGTAYEPTTNGVAIESYTDLTPSSISPVALNPSTIYKTTSSSSGMGYAIKHYTDVAPSDSNPPYLVKPGTAGQNTDGLYRVSSGAGGYLIASNPTSITPSTNMPSLTAGQIYRPSSGGYAISSYTPLTPSDSSPVALTGATVYRATNGSTGYAIESNPTSITPSASGTYFSSGIKKMTTSGYAYTSAQKRTASGTQALSTSAQTKITCGFRPKYIMAYPSSTASQGFCYNADISTTKFRFFNSSGNGDANLGSSTSNYLYSIDDDGFTINKASSARTYYWFASE